MAKHKILSIMCFAVLSLHIRESQSRSLNDDEVEHKIIENTGNIEDWKRECFCFPKTVKGTPLLKFLPVNDEQERLVVYFYKNRNSDELTSIIPSWKKQSIFPELIHDIGGKLETVAPDGIIDPFDTSKVPELDERTTVATPAVTDDQFDFTVNPDVPDLEILNVPIPDNPYYSGVSPKDIKPDVNPSVGKKQEPVIATSIDYSKEPNEPAENQKQTLGTLKGMYKYIGGKLETIAPDGIIDPFDTAEVPELDERTTVATPVVTDDQFDLTVNPDVPDLEILNVPIPDNPYYSAVSPKDIKPDVNPSVGKKQEPVIGTSIDYSKEPNEPAENQKQTLGTLEGTYKYIYELPKYPSPNNNKLSINQQNQNLDLPLEHHYKLIEGMPLPVTESHDPRKQVKYVLPGYGDAVPPSKVHNVSHSGIYIERPNKQSNIIYSGFLPSKNQTFNEWYKEQMEILRSKRPLMFNVLNVHLFKQHLMNALNENGIHLSDDGFFLYDSNGNILKMSDLKLRPVLFGESMNYKDLKQCVIPYDLPYLEAILVTLIYSSRVLAIIPFGLDNSFFSTPQGKIALLCSHSNCYTHESYRSGLPEKEDISSDVNDTVDTEDNHENSNTTEVKPEELIEEQAEYSNNIESKSGYTYVATNMDLPVKLSVKPLQIRSAGDQNSYNLILTPNDSGYWNYPIYYDKKNNFLSQEIPEYDYLSEEEEPTILRRFFNAKTSNEENLHTEETSNQIAEEVEPIFTQDITSENDHSFMAGNDDLPLEVSLESKSGSQNNDEHNGDTNAERLEVIGNEPIYYSNDLTSNNDSPYVALNNDQPVEITSQNEVDNPSDLRLTLTSRNDPGHWAEPINSGNTIYVDGRSAIEEGKSLEDFYISQESPEQPDDDDYEVLMIRIVGGNHATSSGTPVSSKGRSGSDF